MSFNHFMHIFVIFWNCTHFGGDTSIKLWSPIALYLDHIIPDHSQKFVPELMCRRSSSWKVLQLFKTKEVSMRLIPLHPHSWVSWVLIRLCLLCKSIFISCSTHCSRLSQLCPPFLSLLMTTAVKRGESQWTVSRASASVEYYYQVWCMTRNKIKKIFNICKNALICKWERKWSNKLQTIFQ